MENVKKTAVLHKPKKIYKDLISGSGTNALRNTKVVENARYICQQKNRQEMYRKLYSANMADHVQVVVNMQQNSKFIQSITFLQNSPPLIILYTDI